MHTSTSPARVASALLLGSLLALAACKSGESKPPAPPPLGHKAEISNQFTIAAQVVAVAKAERQLTLRRQDGAQFDVKVAESVRNFDQIAAGDELRVRYEESLAAELRPASEKAGPIEGGVMAARAKLGEKPGVGLGMAISLRVKIESIDREKDIVVFSLDSGELIAHRLRTPEGREFVGGLKVGDIVQLDYKGAAAISIEKP